MRARYWKSRRILIVSGIVAVALVVATICIAAVAPYEPCKKIEAPTLLPWLLSYASPASCEAHPHWAAFKDYGPAIAGSWVLIAALFSLVAAAITIDAGRQDAEERRLRQRDAAKIASIAQIEAFWAYVNQRELIPKLNDHIGWLQKKKTRLEEDARLQMTPGEGGARPKEKKEFTLYRRYMGEGWLSLASTGLMDLAEVNPGVPARFVLLAVMVRHTVERFNSLNSAVVTGHTLEEWISIHNDVRQYALNLKAPSRELLTLLGATETDPDKIVFRTV